MTLHACATGTALSEGFAPRQQHKNMESRKNIITNSGEGQCLSPQDRKAVTDIATFMELTEDCPSVNYPLCNLIPEIITEANLISSFNRVISNLRQSASDSEKKDTVVIDGKEYTKRQARYVRKKKEIIEQLKHSISSGEFRITKLTSFDTQDGPKIRTVQAPIVVERMGSNSIMEVIETRLAPVLIESTAASIKGRGPHGLFHEIQAAIEANPNLKYYYQSDYKGYYDHIVHDDMIAIIERYISDPILLPMLRNFVKALHPDGDIGISKGLRSSQFFGNLYLNDLDHAMIEKHGATYYFRFCDDTFILAESKRELWRLRECLHEESSKLGLTIKPSERIAPITAGMDALGYVNFGDYARIRRRTKQNAARKLAKVKSRKRRQEIIGSFKGMACHADCKYIFHLITGKRMKKFSEMGVTYTPADGKKRFPGKVMRLGVIQNKELEIHDYEVEMDTSYGNSRYLVSFKVKATGEWGKFFTASEEMKNILDQISDIEDGFPFETTIVSEIFDGNKQKFSST